MPFNVLIYFMLVSVVSGINKPTGIRATEVRSTSFTITWNIEPPNLYKVSVKTDSRSVANLTSAEDIIDLYKVSRTTSGVSLQPNQPYYITLFAINSSDSTDYNHKKYNITTASPAPTKVRIYFIFQKRFNFEWQHTSNAIAHYNITYTWLNGRNQTTKPSEASPLTILNLIPNTAYNVSVTAVHDSITFSDESKPATSPTKPGPPTLPVLSQPMEPSADPFTMIKVDWNKPDGGDAIDYYVVQWKLSSGRHYNSPPDVDHVAHVAGTTSYSYIINSLIPGESYDMRVRVHNSAGTDYSREATYVTRETSSINKTTNTTTLDATSTEGCSPINLTDVTFRFSAPYVSALSEEKCPNSNRSIANILCRGINQLNINHSSESLKNGYDVTSLNYIPCNFTLENFLNQTQTPTFNVTSENIERLTADLHHLTSEPTSLKIDNIEQATTTLNIIEASSENLTIEPSTLGNILHTINKLDLAVNNVESTTQNLLTQNKSNLIATLNTFVGRVNPPTNNETLTLRSADITVQISSISQRSFNRENNSTTYSDLVFNFDSDPGSTTDSNLVIIPSNTIQLLSQSKSQHNDQSLFVILLTNGSLLDSTQNISQVITIGGRNLPQLSELNFSIQFRNITIQARERKIKNSLKSELHDSRLVERNYETLTWNDAQCSQDFYYHPVYDCQRLSRLTSFSILFSSTIVPSNFALSVVSYIGCGISILSLLATIFIHLRYRKLREKFTTTGLVNISICLITVYLLFAVGVQNASNRAACDGLTFLLHYATLSCLMWMCINAGQMYRVFTEMTYDTSKIKSMKIYLIAYLLPFIIVLINFSVTVLYLDTLSDRTSIYFKSLYRLRHACWLKAPSFHWGFLLPAGLAILFNYFIFISLIKKLTCEKVKIRSSARKKSFKDDVINGIVLATMMGLTWIFGYFLIISDEVIYQTTMQWLFTLTNVFQGLTIFILNCARRDDVKNVWLPSCICSSLNQNQVNQQISTGRSNLNTETKPNESSSRNTAL